MKDTRFLHKARYEESWALVIGIDKYATVSPLGYAVSDAEAVRDALIENFDFPAQNIITLLNSEASKSAILRAFSTFTGPQVGLDDRVIVFFAGHGHTRTGQRGEVGFLVPYDGNPSDISSMIRWDELTRNAELVRAKHQWFIMDACYGGLAVTRGTAPGTARFLKDMYLRRACQVLTAGKADEVVADSGGPLPDHSIFTGHLLEAFQGKAASPEGVITSNGVMNYVYGKVSNDKNSHQTPHFGYIDGDGDLILKASMVDESDEEDSSELDRLISVPYDGELHESIDLRNKISKVKSAIASPNGSIELHDLLAAEVRRFLALTAEDNFSLSGVFSAEEFSKRLIKYEESVGDVSLMLACVAHWGQSVNVSAFKKILARSADRLEMQGGNSVWLALRKYPIVVELFNSGISSVNAGRFDWLNTLFETRLEVRDGRKHSMSLVLLASETILEFNRSNAFKLLPGHEKFKTPVSEYLYKILQPGLDDCLFLGKSYENDFDRFEVFLSLAASDAAMQEDGGSWGPLGRFSWKAERGRSPFGEVVEEADRLKLSWPPLQAGMFGGSYERFKKAADAINSMVSRSHLF